MLSSASLNIHIHSRPSMCLLCSRSGSGSVSRCSLSTLLWFSLILTGAFFLLQTTSSANAIRSRYGPSLSPRMKGARWLLTFTFTLSLTLSFTFTTSKAGAFGVINNTGGWPLVLLLCRNAFQWYPDKRTQPKGPNQKDSTKWTQATWTNQNNCMSTHSVLYCIHQVNNVLYGASRYSI